jgi:RNA polymerase sigma-70 factor (ECF subfamily)
MTDAEVAEAFRRYGCLVAERCRRILRDPMIAEDAMQETFVRLWRFGDSFRAAESKLAWLYRVAERCCFDQLARRSSRAETVLEEVPASAQAGPEAGRPLEASQIVMSFLDRFDERTRQVAVLRYLDEMTHDEIAAVTGWSRQTVHKKLQYIEERAGALRNSLYGGGP